MLGLIAKAALGALTGGGKGGGQSTPASQTLYQPNAQIAAGITPAPYQPRANVFMNQAAADGSQLQQSPAGGKVLQTVQPVWAEAAYAARDAHKAVAEQDPLYGGAYYLSKALFGGNKHGNR